jgi:hypothetical protein
LNNIFKRLFVVVIALIAVSLLCCWFCSSRPEGSDISSAPGKTRKTVITKTTMPEAIPVSDGQPAKARRDYLLVWVFVPLCDNANQGIVPVSAVLGNGQNPRSNLYWGAMYGMKTFFRRSKHWRALQLVSKSKKPAVLDQVGFQGSFSGKRVQVLAWAYDGAQMQQALQDFFAAAAEGQADLVAFCGHNGLMDMKLKSYPEGKKAAGADYAVVLACKSRDYFLKPLRRAGCRPLITTTGFMAPEAYTLEAIIRTWASGGDSSTVKQAAAFAYANYQKCSSRAALRLFAAE